MPEYHGSCHCGSIKFSFESEPIEQSMRCTCSICSRKGALMSGNVIDVKDIKLEAEEGALKLYQFGKKVAKHYFCGNCGIYTHNETVRMPGKCRVNLGCIEGLEPAELDCNVFDGKNEL